MEKIKILLIDDQFRSRVPASDRLEAKGYVVIEATNGRTGYEMACKEQPNLIILDWLMPGMDGLQVLKLLGSTSQTNWIPVLIYSVMGSEIEVQIEAYNNGANICLPKVVRNLPHSSHTDLDLLETTVRQLLKPRRSKPGRLNGFWSLDPDKMPLIKGKPFNDFTKYELEVYRCLVSSKGRVVDWQELEAAIYGENTYNGVGNVKKVFDRLRDKLQRNFPLVMVDENCLRIHRGRGCELNDPLSETQDSFRSNP